VSLTTPSSDGSCFYNLLFGVIVTQYSNKGSAPASD
jgi:hypothetical protein